LELSNNILDSSSENIHIKGQTLKEGNSLNEKENMYMCPTQPIDIAIISPGSDLTDCALRPKLDMKDHVVLCVFANKTPLVLHNFLRLLQSHARPAQNLW